MAKRKAASYMTSGQRAAGVILFLVYLLVLPLVTDPFFAFCEEAVGAPISPALRSAVYYGVLLAVCLLVFHKFLGRTTDDLGENLGPACQAVLMGLVGMYGMNELLYRLGGLLLPGAVNLNNAPISAQIEDAPRFSFVIIVFLAPFVEEVLFRGLVFGSLKGRSRTVAYVLSCLLFALAHVWAFAAEGPTFARFLAMVQYLVPGLMLCWSYERGGTLWSPIALHSLFNALAIWT